MATLPAVSGGGAESNTLFLQDSPRCRAHPPAPETRCAVDARHTFPSTDRHCRRHPPPPIALPGIVRGVLPLCAQCACRDHPPPRSPSRSPGNLPAVPIPWLPLQRLESLPIQAKWVRLHASLLCELSPFLPSAGSLPVAVQ